MADEGHTEMSNASRKSIKKTRGPYNQYLSEPKGKVPRSTLQKWPDKNEAHNISFSDPIDESSFEPIDDVGDQREHDDHQSSFLSLVGKIGNCGSSSRDENDEMFTDFEELYGKIFQNIQSSNPVSSVDHLDHSPSIDGSSNHSAEEQDEREDNSQVLHENSVEGGEDDADEEYFDAFDEENPTCNENDIGDVPLYNGAQITVGVSMLLIITFAIRHSLTGQALLDLLTLINLHCSLENNFASSLALLKKFFVKLKSPIQFHYYCTFCMEYQGLSLSDNGLCKNKFCLKNQKEKRNSSYFIIIPLMSQLQDLAKRTGFLDLLKYPLTRTKTDPQAIEDVQDGELYLKHFSKDGFFKGTSDNKKKTQVHISFQINTDGVALFNSSKYSIWPIYLLINELPPKSRFARSSSIFLGLWFGYKKPDFLTFLQPFSKEFQDIYSKGLQVTTSEGKRVTLRGILLNGTMDAPAKCLLQNLVQFNGYNGCPYCLNEGISVSTSAKGHTLTYPFNKQQPMNGYGEDRTHEGTLEHAYSAHQSKLEGNYRPVFGVKGYSWLMFVPGFDIVRGIAVDYMHCVLLGVTKMLMTLWFDKSHANEEWSISKRVEDVDQRLLNITPPNCISRAPRSISKDFSHWKASEFRSFLFFYGIPCLWNILPDEYFQHFLLLAEAIWLLDQNSISPQCLDKSSNLLRHFCLRIEALYGSRYQTFNAHCLLHLHDCVKNLGPLWANSCFWYEDYNGQLRKLFHGTQKVEMQIAFSVCIQQKVPELIPLLPPHSSSEEFYNSMTQGKYSLKCKREKISDNIFSLGVMSPAILNPSLHIFIESSIGQISQAFLFKRIQINTAIIHSKSYLNVSRRNSFTVFVKDTGFVQVKCYIKLYFKCRNVLFCTDACSCKLPKYYGIADCCLKPATDIQLSSDKFTDCKVGHVYPVRKEACNNVVFPVTKVEALCVSVDCGYSQCMFVCKLPNHFEKD